ncbi:related to nadh-ubiquinone oxidoreductase subunit b17.2 [Sporisorium reilianum SRZ2]|uniref:NADH dehydrogenase [ubiquinone] 1 alpha subcomplex subunit n=2 Tax=Sporisorium reilianum TaxID=72558 RepID=E6ZPJ7_SPORE|nr:related to nadh-ubiquinone oxidoreductase subunit b17.2 [Sporisorium reilianum SRZ2]SJX64794.1 related to nadh-ubiquinone oxidoreductase subunit b17.2 [Sporisorium reilianum f. sp. reilianum]
MSLARTINYIRREGLRKFWRDLNYIGDAKSGRLVGIDRNGNKYYENHDEFPLRHRWIDYAADNEFNASQVDPLWHSWLHHIRKDPPHEDKGIQKMTQAWMTTPRENITGTRGAFKTYNTTKPKISAWEPKVAPRA